MEQTAGTNGQPQELSHEESRELFDRQARRYLEMSGDEFIQRWDAGEYGDPDDRSRNLAGVMNLAMLLPYVR